MKLLIAIPALNEEESIESIITRSLAARNSILANSPVTDVEITVVSDGSTDRTVELASRYADRIKVIVFEKNRGYGAAIKEAWQQSQADLLGFLDADGTCDPAFFGPLCQTLVTKGGDIVLGCRLNPESKMPVVRRLGNVLFASLLSVFSSQRVRDTASGMRVIRRSILPHLMPLPDGLHFTPAMSARAVLHNELKIVEIPMPYHEREGESKLRIAKDGMRFLRVIIEAAFLYRPSRPLGLIGLLCGAIACALMVMPTLYYIQHHSVLEWMIYRFIVFNLLCMSGCLLLCASYLSSKIVALAVPVPQPKGWSYYCGTAFFSHRLFFLVPIILILGGGILVLPSFIDLVKTGATYEHWSRFVVMSLFLEIALILVMTRVLDFILNLIAAYLAYLKSQQHAELRRVGG
jgi:glycosyltransferase involved in cell wall biosynthesis